MKDIVVITGANSGIGLALIEEYRKIHAVVVGLDIDVSVLKVKNIPCFQCDVSNFDEFEKTAQRVVKEYGKPTLWFNNAGIQILGSFENFKQSDFQKVMGVNFNGVVNGTHIAMSLMKNPIRGKIVNVSSINGFVPAPYMSAYVASKHAVVGFTRSLQIELEQSHSPLKLTLICPGFVKTPIMGSQKGFKFPKWLEFLVDTPESTVKQILDGLKKDKKEIFTTKHGRMLIQSFNFLPQITLQSSRLLVAKNLKELLGLTPIKRD